MSDFKSRYINGYLRRKRRQRLLDLLGRVMTVSGIAGYVVGVVAGLFVLYQMGYSVWVMIAFVPVVLVASVGYGVPVGLIAGVPLMVLLAGFIRWRYPEERKSEI